MLATFSELDVLALVTVTGKDFEVPTVCELNAKVVVDS
jgi:hypothetical protein